MYKPTAALHVLLMISVPGTALSQSPYEDPMDLELEQSSPPPARAPAKAPAPEGEAEANEEDLDLGEEKSAGGLATFDPRLQLDEPGVVPPEGLAPIRRLSAPLSQDRGEQGEAWPLWPALVTGGVAAVTLGVGLYLVSIDETGAQCQGEPRPDLRNCIEVYNTGDAGYALTAVGIASLATSGLFLYLFMSKRLGEPEEEGIAGVTVAPDGRGGFLVGASGWF